MGNGSGYLFGGDWTHDKLRMLRDYLRAYSKIMKDRPYTYGYIDAFAGTGHLASPSSGTSIPSFFPAVNEPEKDFLAGSTRVALEVEPAFDRYVFIEKDPGAFAQLENLEAEYPEKDILFEKADANDWLVNKSGLSWREHRAVVFLDPFGMQVEWRTIEALARTKAVDLWILFPLGIAVNRLLTNDGRIPPEWQSRLDEVFGTPDWREAFYSTRTDLFGKEIKEKNADFNKIGEYYNNRLKSIFAQVAPNPRPLYNSTGNPLYLLCFAVANPHAAETAVKIAQHILGR